MMGSSSVYYGLRRLAIILVALSAAANFAASHLRHHPSTSTTAITQADGVNSPPLTPLAAPYALAFEPVIPARPSFVCAENVSQKYPATLMNKLFSSVPKRECAVQNINLSFGHEHPSQLSQSPTATRGDDGLTLLVGRSASGKSTLLRLLAGMEAPSEGCVNINGCKIDCNADVGVMPQMPPWAKMGLPTRLDIAKREECSCRVHPVILQGKPDFDDRLSVMERIVEMGLSTLHRCNKEWNVQIDPAPGEMGTAVQTLASDFASLLTLSEEQCNSPPSQLSPSGQYLFGIACGSIISVAPWIAIHSDSIASIGIPYPILLLDELFDTEHPSTVEKCSKGLRNLIRAGAVVLSATHRPGYFDGLASRTVTLGGGKVLSDTYSLK